MGKAVGSADKINSHEEDRNYIKSKKNLREKGGFFRKKKEKAQLKYFD